ncbi:HIT family protein [Streptomyces goshikiensis]
MVEPDSCAFCAIIAGEDSSARVVYRNDRFTVFFPLDPATPGHTLVVPNRHVADFTDLTASESRDLGEAVHRTARAVRSALSPDGMNLIQSTGASATQTVLHVHFHVLPRWQNDRMALSWPTGAAEGDSALDQTLTTIQRVFPSEASATSSDDRRQHLSFIQAVVTRMSQASSSSKSWLLPIVTLTYGYAITRGSISVGLIGCLAVLVFGLLDANYLKQERAFRKLYDEVASGRPIPAFSMNPTLASPAGARSNYWPDKPDIRSWAVAPVYLPLILAGLAIIALLLYRK